MLARYPLLLCVLFILAAGCAGIPASSSENALPPLSGGGLDFLSDRTQEGGQASSALPERESGGGASTGTLESQKIVRTARIHLEVQDVPAAVSALEDAAREGGGYIASSSLRRDSSDRSYAEVVLRVPAGGYSRLVEEIPPLGKVLSREERGQDVTEEYIDLQARKRALDCQLEQYQRIMLKAERVEDVLKVQTEIERVQVEIERVAGRLRYLNDRIDLATITVSLAEPVPVGEGVRHDFAATLNTGILGFFWTIDLIVVLFFALLPLLVLGGGALVVYRWWRRRQVPIP
ncbi:MAG: DUF4349 domain-containing protein [Methanomicrobiales archaeon]|nr:DUF4349 domain-containing protein [Methanomicrobiales archaeon]